MYSCIATRLLLGSLSNCYKSLVLCDIHGNKLCQIDLITGAPHGMNPSLLNLLGACLYMGRIYVFLNFVKEKLYSVNHWQVLYDIHRNELRQIDLITGAPHGVNLSSLNLFGVCLYMGRVYVHLLKDRVLLSLMKSM